MSKVEQKLQSINAVVDKVGLTWRKVGNIDGKMVELEEAVKKMNKK